MLLRWFMDTGETRYFYPFANYLSYVRKYHTACSILLYAKKNTENIHDKTLLPLRSLFAILGHPCRAMLCPPRPSIRDRPFLLLILIFILNFFLWQGRIMGHIPPQLRALDNLERFVNHVAGYDRLSSDHERSGGGDSGLHGAAYTALGAVHFPVHLPPCGGDDSNRKGEHSQGRGEGGMCSMWLFPSAALDNMRCGDTGYW